MVEGHAPLTLETEKREARDMADPGRLSARAAGACESLLARAGAGGSARRGVTLAPEAAEPSADGLLFAVGARTFCVP
jgi:hypothetical protein